jgi:hypothetical protein
MATREIKTHDRSKDVPYRSKQVSKKLLPQSYPDGEADSKSPPRGPNHAALAGASTGPDYRRLTFPQICDIKINQHIQTS